MEPVIFVSDHALWRAAERFRESVFGDEIERDVREALKAGRCSAERAHLGLHPWPEPNSLYVWTPGGERIYAIRVDQYDPRRFVVTTTMKPEEGATLPSAMKKRLKEERHDRQHRDHA